MRKHQQKQILDLLETLKEAQAAGFYADCQDAALSIGAFIESLEGEGTRTVALLEAYNELLFKANNGEVGQKSLQKHLIKIEKSVRTELRPNRVEFAFLAYNASMSDAIEGIYQAAKADPNCDAYWIPIPYWEKNSDGSFGEMHYQGADCYGAEFECVDWREYDIAARRPDAIFTFAPYDATNHVTSVHPDHYCQRLKDLTDCLVYVPYFIAIADVQESFCTLAGCVFAHKVMLQSEKVRSTYIRVFKDLYGDSFGKPEDKFVALGSPKLDKVLDLKREQFVLPSAWETLIGDKKVVFYNTSIVAILMGTQQYLHKLRSVLDAFRAREDVVLWWRPHPLNEVTYKSMLPRLLEEYEQIIADYRRAGWGIYDDTPELHPALAWCDAYYGDWSSVVQLFHAVGKSVVIQDVHKPGAYTELGYPLPLLLGAAGDTLYYAAYQRNALLALDLNTLSPRYLQPVPNHSVFGKSRLYNCAEVVDDQLYLIPATSDTLAIYDCKAHTCETVALALQEPCMPQEAGKFYASVCYRHRLFMLPFAYGAIVAYDMQTGETLHCLDLKPVLRELGVEATDKTRYFHQYAWLDDTRILLPLRGTNAVLEFDLEHFDYRTHTIGGPGDSLVAIAQHGDYYWVTCHNRPAVIQWHYATQETQEHTAFPTGFGINDAGLSPLYFAPSAIVHHQCHLYLFPVYANMVCRLNMDTGVIEHLEEFDPYCAQPAAGRALFTGCCVHGGKVYVWSEGAENRMLLEYDAASRKIRACNTLFELPEADNPRLAQDYIRSLLNGAEGGTQLGLPALTGHENAGQAIYDHIKTAALA